MSEKKKTQIVELKPEDRDLLKSNIKAVQALQDAQKTPAEDTHSDEAGKSHKEGHETLEEMIDCPNCYPKVRDAVFQKELPSLKEAEHVCQDCGMPVKLDADSCLFCGGKDAKER